jgi:hypothetical protein
MRRLLAFLVLVLSRLSPVPQPYGAIRSGVRTLSDQCFGCLSSLVGHEKKPVKPFSQERPMRKLYRFRSIASRHALLAAATSRQNGRIWRARAKATIINDREPEPPPWVRGRAP